MTKEATLVERLRDLNPWSDMGWPETVREAATTLEAQSATIARLEGALDEIASSEVETAYMLRNIARSARKGEA